MGLSVVMGRDDHGTAIDDMSKGCRKATLPEISNGDQKSSYLSGPDQLILETDGWTTSRPDGAVDIRRSPDDAPVISVPEMCRRTAEKFGSKMAMAVKRHGEWKEWTYKATLIYTTICYNTTVVQISNCYHKPFIGTTVTLYNSFWMSSFILIG